MTRLLAFLALALVVPSLAFAAKPPTPGNSQATTHGKAAPHVMYVLKGTLVAYTAASGTTNGSLVLLVKSANHHGASLKGQTLTLLVSPATRITTKDGAAVTVNDNGVVQLRAPKTIGATDSLASVLQALAAKHVIDQGPAS